MYNDLERILLTKEQIAARVKELGAEISKDYADKNPLVVCILKGSVLFFADLIKEITVPINLDFMAVSSYGCCTVSSGQVKMIKDLDSCIDGRHVIIVEDIVDTGHTLSYLIKNLKSRNPASVKICTLLDKKCRREVELTPDYFGFEVDNFFVVGYGLDYDEDYRHLPEVGVLKPEIYNK
jgi:hypoxanthine phosphoribosyltransferase